MNQLLLLQSPSNSGIFPRSPPLEPEEVDMLSGSGFGSSPGGGPPFGCCETESEVGARDEEDDRDAEEHEDSEVDADVCDGDHEVDEEDLAIDMEILGEHLVLLGNQGVGKNKVVDRLCQVWVVYRLPFRSLSQRGPPP